MCSLTGDIFPTLIFAILQRNWGKWMWTKIINNGNCAENVSFLVWLYVICALWEFIVGLARVPSCSRYHLDVSPYELSLHEIGLYFQLRLRCGRKLRWRKKKPSENYRFIFGIMQNLRVCVFMWVVVDHIVSSLQWKFSISDNITHDKNIHTNERC